ncbi:hypothetical protein Tco_0618846 [Tanacetum coccineum]
MEGKGMYEEGWRRRWRCRGDGGSRSRGSEVAGGKDGRGGAGGGSGKEGERRGGEGCGLVGAGWWGEMGGDGGEWGRQEDGGLEKVEDAKRGVGGSGGEGKWWGSGECDKGGVRNKGAWEEWAVEGEWGAEGGKRDWNRGAEGARRGSGESVRECVKEEGVYREAWRVVAGGESVEGIGRELELGLGGWVEGRSVESKQGELGEDGVGGWDAKELGGVGDERVKNGRGRGVCGSGWNVSGGWGGRVVVGEGGGMEEVIRRGISGDVGERERGE